MTRHRLRSLVRLVVALALSTSGALGDDEARPATPSYTDVDLARYATAQPPTSSPAPADPAPSTRARRRSASATGAGSDADADREAAQRVSEERYWRREAERTRERVRRLEDQAAALEVQLSERRRAPRRGAAAAAASANASLAALERRAGLARERAREAWDAFEDRARREGALPGWIR